MNTSDCDQHGSLWKSSIHFLTRELRDQGLTRPKVLILLPFRDAALRTVTTLMQLMSSDGEVRRAFALIVVSILHHKHPGSIQVSGDAPTLPWVWSRVWVKAGLALELALREGWVDTSSLETWIDSTPRHRIGRTSPLESSPLSSPSSSPSSSSSSSSSWSPRSPSTTSSPSSPNQSHHFPCRRRLRFFPLDPVLCSLLIIFSSLCFASFLAEVASHEQKAFLRRVWWRGSRRVFQRGRTRRLPAHVRRKHRWLLPYRRVPDEESRQVVQWILLVRHHHRFSAWTPYDHWKWRVSCCSSSVWHFYSQEWSTSNFSCSLTSNITSHGMNNLAFHSLLRGKMIIVRILICLWEVGRISFFELGSERVNFPAMFCRAEKGERRDSVAEWSGVMNRNPNQELVG